MLLGLDCCYLLPDKIDQIGNLQLMYGPLGHCLRGAHHLIEFENNCADSSSARVYLTHMSCLNVKQEIGKFFELESIGTLPNINCESCDRDNDELAITIKQNKELKMIKEGLHYNAMENQWYVHYPWIKDVQLLPNNYTSAFGQLKSLEKRLLKQPKDVALYCDQIQES